MNCGACKSKSCYEGKDCISLKDKIKEYYKNPPDRKIMEAASEIEAENYMKATRLEELILFSKKMEYKKIGIAFCIGLSEEGEILEKILKQYFDVSSVCCKVCGINKKDYNLKQIDEARFEAMCDPIGQAEILNKDETDINIILGLCMGNDILFTKYSKAPVSTFIVKDRVLSHNPAGAIYSGYYKNKLKK